MTDVPACSFTKYTLSLLFALTSILSACAGQEAGESRDFLIRSDTANVEEVSHQLIVELSTQLLKAHSLQEGYPIFGRVAPEPHPTDPGVYFDHCAPDRALSPPDAECILLNKHGDFIKMLIVSRKNSAVYFAMYRIYVAPNNPFVRVDPDANFVAFEVFIREEETLGQLVDESIREAAKQNGAHPFSP